MVLNMLGSHRLTSLSRVSIIMKSKSIPQRNLFNQRSGGFRRRSDARYNMALGAFLGLISGYYIFHDYLMVYIGDDSPNYNLEDSPYFDNKTNPTKSTAPAAQPRDNKKKS